MKSFTLRLHDMNHSERIENVSSFVGEDESGSFGILAGHERMMTVLSFGLARFRTAAGAWQYLAMPGAVLYFINDELLLYTRHYLCDDNYERISTALQEQLLTEEQQLHDIRTSLHIMEEELLKRMWRIGQEETHTA